MAILIGFDEKGREDVQMLITSMWRNPFEFDNRYPASSFKIDHSGSIKNIHYRDIVRLDYAQEGSPDGD